MTAYLSLTDLFLVGLAFDICGAVLLAKGLLLSPRGLAKLNTWFGVGRGGHQDRCENRVDAEFGVSYLTAGFALQTIGYTLDIAGVGSETGVCRLIAGLLLSVAAAGAAWGGWKMFRGSRLRRLEAAIERESEAAGEEIEAAEAQTGDDN